MSAPVRVLRVIARLNVGGPAYHVSLLSGRLDRDKYWSLLTHGEIGRGEASFEELAKREGCRVELIPGLGPQIRPTADLRALVGLIRLMRRVRPDIVETHTAKAGGLGRLAALTLRPRPLIVHTYHGHVLEGYFGRLMSGFYRQLERRLARVSDALVTVSEATVDDLVRLGIASRDRFRVIPLGLDLARFAALSKESGSSFRTSIGAESDSVVVTSVGRLVPIKRIDVLLRAFASARKTQPTLKLVIVGDGEVRADLERLCASLGVSADVRFVGFLTDVTPVVAAADIAVLSSDNEGTPISLIEAAAAGVPAVATAVGGVPDVVTERSGVLVAPGNHEAMAAALVRVAEDPAHRAQLGRHASAHVRERFSVERLLRDVDALYQELLGRRGPAGAR